MESSPSILVMAVILLGTSVIAVPLFQRLGLGLVVGYLMAGVLLGPSLLNVVPSPEALLHFSEIGVVLLLFLIGLELNPRKLWTMRKSIFGAGAAQTLLTCLAGMGIGMLFGLSWQVSLISAMAISLSSTAIAVQVLKEKNWMNNGAGQSAFAVLLFQDLAVIPMLALIPWLASMNSSDLSDSAMAGHSGVQSIWLSLGAVIIVVLLGRFIIRPVFRLLAATRLREVLTAFSLLLVLGIALLMSSVGLSMALGTFLAGVLLAESEYRHEIEMDLEPFRGLLLGLFFMSVGMSMNLGVIFTDPLKILILVVGILALKFLINQLVARAFSLRGREGVMFSSVLAQGGEFAFVLLGIGAQAGGLQSGLAQQLSLAIALSMMLAPILISMVDRLYISKLDMATEGKKKAFDDIHDEQADVIIAGYGRFGQMVGRVLHSLKVKITVLEADPSQIEIMRKFGWKTFYGDATRVDLLEAAGIARAQILVVAIDDVDSTNRIVDEVRSRWPKVRIIARARNRAAAFDLIARDTLVVRELAAGSIEMAEKVLVGLGYGRHEAFQISRKFYNYDLKLLSESAPNAGNQQKLISSAHQSRENLIRLMEKDERQFRSEDHPEAWN